MLQIEAIGTRINTHLTSNQSGMICNILFPIKLEQFWQRPVTNKHPIPVAIHF